LFLKRLEIHGFKSFADRTTFTFQPGITAIVGPNGSGKSNIVDSLRWVMGEHNLRNLRGTKLEDIIFAGSDDRKPLGMADVTLVMDNSDHTFPLDFTEVAVSRRFYRSGESEFLINKSPVRLKDIQELFFDTGLGKESYSIISQGKIDSLLSLKPEERRFVFEEAAGIMKYKNKKNLTIKKLTDTENSLLRIQDILQELRAQIIPLAEQAEKARVYLGIRKELKTLELNYYHKELKKISETVHRLETEKIKINEEACSLKAEEEKLEEELVGLKIQINELEKMTQTKQELLLSQSTQKERALGELRLFDERNRYLEERKREIEEFLSEQEKRLVELESKKGELQKQAEEIALEKERLHTEVHTLETKLTEHEERLTATRLKIKEKEATLAKHLEKIADLKQNVNEVILQNDYRREREKEAEDRLELIIKDQKELEEKIKRLETNLDSSRKQLGGLVHDEKVGLEKLNQARTYLVNREEKNQEIRNKLRGIESKINFLEEMDKNHQGYFHGVKSLLEAKREPFHEEIHGVVADLIQVHHGYEVALETALGATLQNLVISHDRYARAAIDFLKRHSLGRATFLPLNLIDNPPDRLSGIKKLLAQYKCIPATDGVKYDSRYEAIIFHLLGNTILAPDLAAAVSVTEKTGKRFRLVTLDGDLISAGGAITGGRTERRQAGPLVRRRDIMNLKKEKNDILAFMERGLQEESGLKTEISKITEELEAIKTKRQETNFKQNSLLKEVELTSEQHKKTIAQKTQVEEALHKIRTEITTQVTGISNLQETLSKAEAIVELNNQELKELEKGEGEILKSKEDDLRQISAHSAKLAGVRQEWLGKAEYLKEQDLVCLNLMEETERRKNELIQNKQEILELKAERTSLFETIERSEAQRKELEEDLEVIKVKWQSALDSAAQKEERLRTIRRFNAGHTSELHRFELQINRLNSQAENTEAQLQEVYGETWRSQVPGLDLHGDTGFEQPLPKNPKQEIERLKRKMKEMEPVNVQAIGDYEKQKAREFFLSKQYEDLVTAKSSLEKVIVEIEKTITKRFVQTFQQIREEFIKLFKELFSGGKADIKLTEEENPLESGIEIYAQPPGKRLQTLSLLSGGERAMTAISLLFAILKVKPSPFCLLDEIDATLDDSNVKRFANLLQIFSNGDKLQFIVITHRRGTMEKVGTLYGVTMEEKGVSKLISLDLNQAAS